MKHYSPFVAALLLLLATAVPASAQLPGTPVQGWVNEAGRQAASLPPREKVTVWLALADRIVGAVPGAVLNAEALAALSTGYQHALNEAEASLPGDGPGRAQALIALQNAAQRHYGVLQGVLQRVPEPARAGLSQALASSQRGLDLAHQRVQQAGPPRGAGPRGHGMRPGVHGGAGMPTVGPGSRFPFTSAGHGAAAQRVGPPLGPPVGPMAGMNPGRSHAMHSRPAPGGPQGHGAAARRGTGADRSGREPMGRR